MILTFQFPHFTPVLADLELGQIVVFVVAAIVAFVQWLIKVFKEKAEAAERARHVPTEEEVEARKRAWKEQTRQADAPPMPSPAPTGGTLDELMDELRSALKPQPAPPPKAPPPLPKPATRASSKPLAPPIHVRAVEASIPVPTLLPVMQLHGQKGPHPLTQLLRTPDGYRQAFVLREVLGPPRALQEYQGPD